MNHNYSPCKEFPPFQRHILDSGICPIVFSLVQHDSEAYVRASALTCLTEMVNVPLFWSECLCQLDLLPYLMHEVLVEESEGVVRREGVALLTAIYEKKKLVPPRDSLDRVFSVMTYCAVNDLYWEVKTNALKFWMEVMCRQFQHQGVIDNTFPSVTFSKEHKKIVQLTQKEILLRLTKVIKIILMCDFRYIPIDTVCILEFGRTMKIISKTNKSDQ